MKRFISFILLFFYIYSTQFVFIPGSIGTRAIMGVLGFCSFIINFRCIKNNKYLLSRLKKIIQALIPIPVIALFSLLINSSGDFEFVKYFVSIILIFFASYFVIINLKKNKIYNLFDLINFFSYVVFAQLIISIVAFLFPGIKEFLMSVQVWDGDEQWLGETVSVRLVGLGASFFGAGITNSFCLLLITYEMLHKKLSKYEIIKELLLFLFILLFGIFMARTTVIGLFLSLFLIVVTKRKYIVNKWTAVFPTLLIIIPLFYIIYTKYVLNNPTMELLVDQGYEMIINTIEGDDFSSKSTNRLVEMYESYPSRIWTYLFGDGYYTDPIDGMYYMHIDIGYFRLIYYFGIIGLFFFLRFQYKVTCLACSSFLMSKQMLISLCALFLLLNLKGFSDIVCYLFLFIFSTPNHWKANT